MLTKTPTLSEVGLILYDGQAMRLRAVLVITSEPPCSSTPLSDLHAWRGRNAAGHRAQEIQARHLLSKIVMLQGSVSVCLTSNRRGMRLAKRKMFMPGLMSRPPMLTAASTTKAWPSSTCASPAQEEKIGKQSTSWMIDPSVVDVFQKI